MLHASRDKSDNAYRSGGGGGGEKSLFSDAGPELRLGREQKKEKSRRNRWDS